MGRSLTFPIFRLQKESFMDSIIFPRTGEIPLEFTGEIIFTETTDTPGKKKCSRYHQLRLARTEGGSFRGGYRFSRNV